MLALAAASAFDCQGNTGGEGAGVAVGIGVGETLALARGDGLGRTRSCAVVPTCAAFWWATKAFTSGVLASLVIRP